VGTTTGHRILIVVSNLGTGGAEWQTMHLAKGLAARGHDVTIAAQGHVRAPVEPLRAAGVRVLGLRAVGPRARLVALPSLVRLARRRDVVHCTNWDSSLFGRVAGLLAGRPVVVADHFADRANHRSRRGVARGRWVAAHHRVLGPLSAATVVCARAQEAVLLGEGVPRDRLEHIPNGVPVAELRTAARGGPSRGDLGIPDDALVVMHVAKFRAEKNHEQTLATVGELRGSLGGVRAVFVGHGPTEAAMRRRADETGAHWATFLGDRSDVPALLGLADLLVLPSHAEAMPMVLLEAQVLGVPVVASDVGDVRAILEATGGGLAVAPADGVAFTAACRHVLEDAELRAELSRRGRSAAPRFGADAMVDRYAAVYDAAIAGRRPHPPPLRVLHVGPDLNGRGGMPAVVRDLLSSPLADAHRLAFIPTYGSATYGRADRRERAATFARGLGRLVVWCLRPGRRLVHIHTATRGSWYRKATCVLAARALGRPVLLHVHAGPGDIAAFCTRTGPLGRRFLRLGFRAADRVISVSDATAREVERGLGVTGIVTVPTPAPLSRVPVAVPAPRRPDEPVHVLYVGGFANAAKGGQVLLEALPDLVAAAPGVSVKLAGMGDAPALDGLAGWVRWLGWLDSGRAAAELAAADVIVLPSVSEGLPVALLEALAHGRAIVATRVGGMPEILTDDVDGVLVDPGEPRELAGAIAALARDPERRERLGRAARMRAERLSRVEVYDRLDGLYRSLAGGPPAAPRAR
jgi:glycosyltransferase involved in cell wall biosynthesis